MNDIFEKKRCAYLEQLETAKASGETGFLDFGKDAAFVGLKPQYFLISGKEVTKEIFILNSGMEHLILDRSMVQCTRCGRKVSPDNYKKKCGIAVIGEPCQGIFF